MYFRKKEFLDAAKGIQKQLDMIMCEIKKIGKASIVCRRKKHKIYYSERCAGLEHGITQNITRIHQLVKKEYLLETARILNHNLKVIKYCYDNYLNIVHEDIADSISQKKRNLSYEIILDAVKSSWQSEAYTKNPYHAENLQYVTTNGVVVRSKSEREIANTLETLGIPYKYDVKIQCSSNTYFADFVIERPDGTLLIWEHFGLENNESYMASNEIRIKDYIKLGYRPWDNLIWTLESDIKDSRTIRTIIQRFILCDINAG